MAVVVVDVAAPLSEDFLLLRFVFAGVAGVVGVGVTQAPGAAGSKVDCARAGVAGGVRVVPASGAALSRSDCLRWWAEGDNCSSASVSSFALSSDWISLVLQRVRAPSYLILRPNKQRGFGVAVPASVGSSSDSDVGVGVRSVLAGGVAAVSSLAMRSLVAAPAMMYWYASVRVVVAVALSDAAYSFTRRTTWFGFRSSKRLLSAQNVKSLQLRVMFASCKLTHVEAMKADARAMRSALSGCQACSNFGSLEIMYDTPAIRTLEQATTSSCDPAAAALRDLGDRRA